MEKIQINKYERQGGKENEENPAEQKRRKGRRIHLAC